ISPCGLARAKLKNVIGSIAETSARASFLGEAGAMLVLEPLSSAVARGASILGRIAGFGFSCERSDDGRFASRQAICSAMRAALGDAGLAPGGIDRVMLGSFDPNELDAVHAVFGKEGRPPVIVAAPRAVGETYAAGPVLHAVLALSISAGAALPDNVRLPARSPGPGGFGIGRILVNGLSCEGGCGSMIIEGANAG
ncbi:MAG: hypothetical protein P4L55_20305, partial [Syntrophobacteraceae bacterium]|nr:hypothetical protein [Syntrophobacteraceae bacterium]